MIFSPKFGKTLFPRGARGNRTLAYKPSSTFHRIIELLRVLDDLRHDRRPGFARRRCRDAFAEVLREEGVALVGALPLGEVDLLEHLRYVEVAGFDLLLDPLERVRGASDEFAAVVVAVHA